MAILLVVVFILVMQFLWLYIDELVGKGLSIKVIFEFLGWGSITMLPLSLPLATLLASMMTLGTLGQNNELLAIKAAGVSLQRVLVPLGAACLVVSIGAFFVSNDLMPVAFNKIYTLRDDIGKTKNRCQFNRTVEFDDVDVTALGAVIAARNVGKLGCNGERLFSVVFKVCHSRNRHIAFTNLKV